MRKVPFEKALFLGVAGILILSSSIVCFLLFVIWPNRISSKTNRNAFFLCMLFLILMWIFSLGPFLQFGYRSTGIKLPYYYLYQLSYIFASIRCPARIVVFLSLPLSLLILWWCEEAGHWKSLPLKQILLGVLALAVFFDVYARREISTSKEVYDYTYIYTYVNRMPGDVLLELPSGLTCHNLRGRAVRAQ
jgi:hypothetical protein